jgi:hypothetical protein
MSPQIVQVLAGTSSVLGLLAVAAYFVFQMQSRTAERSVREIVEGDPLFDAAQVVKILAQFGDDERRLKALEILAHHDRGRAQHLLNKIKDDVDVNRLNRTGLEHQRRTLLIAGAALMVLGLMGLAYAWIQGRPVESVTRDSLPPSEAPRPAPVYPESSPQNEAPPALDAISTRGQPAGPSSLVAYSDVVLDRSSGLLWLRDTFRLGCTDGLFTKSHSGSGSLQADRAALTARVRTLSPSNITGWRIAKQSDIDALAKNSGASLFAAFAVHRIATGATNLISIYGPDSARFTAWGYQHANYLNGPLTWGVGGYEVNEYGVWVVSGPVSLAWKHPAGDAGVSITVPPESRMGVQLEPILVAQMHEKNDAISTNWQSVSKARVGNLDGEERFVAEYDFKVLPRGALVRVELGLEGQSASGLDPGMTIGVYEGSGLLDEARPTQWSPTALDSPLKWSFSASARLALPEHVARNAYNTEGILGVHFNYNGKLGAVDFSIPSLTVTYVPEADRISSRKLAYVDCGS